MDDECKKKDMRSIQLAWDFRSKAEVDKARKEDAANTVLKDHLKKVADWMEKLVDPELGPVGAAFNKAFAATACKEEARADIPHNPVAAYNTFCSYPNDGKPSFTNIVSYSTEVADDGGYLFTSRTHEFVHVMQYNKTPALHADPYNTTGTNIVLSPLDYMRRKVLIEQDAHAKDTWLSSLAAKDHPEVYEAKKRAVLPIDRFEAIRKKCVTMDETIREAAKSAAGTVAAWVSRNDPMISAEENWNNIALNEYIGLIRKRLDRAEKLTFIRLGEEDIYTIGESFGPNPFGKDGKVHPEFLKPPVLSEANRKALEDLNKELSISAGKPLPTLREALLVEFLERSRTPAPPVRQDNLPPPRPPDHMP